MKHTFKLIYELDTTVGCAVAAYLDAEHYVFLHNKYSPQYEVVERNGRKIKIGKRGTTASSPSASIAGRSTTLRRASSTTR